MKKLLIVTLGAVLAAASAYAQGQIILVTKNLTGAGGALVNGAFGGQITGANAQLFLVTGTAPNLTYTPLQPTTTLKAAGQVGAAQSTVVTVPNVAPGSTAQFALAAYQGASYSSASALSKYSG